jgi:hypothetical protein
MKNDYKFGKMVFKKKGVLYKPLQIFPVNGKFVIAVYKGSLSKFDILIKYKQKIGGKWSKLRTPKHIHWAVDILIKINFNKKITQDFINLLIKLWEKTKPIECLNDRKEYLKINKLIKLEIDSKRAIQYKKMCRRGEYSLNFLILLAKLLMIQEKTNRRDAYMFKKLLESLKEGRDIFAIVSRATHNGR